MSRPAPDPVLAPLALALRRLRARRWGAAGAALAVAAAVGLMLAVSVLGALAREESARGRVSELSERGRLVQVLARAAPASQPDGGWPGPIAPEIGVPRQPGVPPERLRAAAERALAGLGLGPPVTVLASGPVSPADERGTRVVHVSTGPPRAAAGRAARGCDERRCEVLALGANLRIGDRVRLGRVRARVVGRTALPPGLAPPSRVLRGRAVLIADLQAFRAATRDTGAWVVTSRALRPGAVAGTAIGGLAERMRRAAARFERAHRGATMATPASALRRIDERGRTAQRRLLLIGAQGAALFLAFAALLGVARRRDTERLGTQLRALGATRWQPGLVRLVEVAVPPCLGAALALVLAAAATGLLAARRDLDGFAGAALPPEALALVGLLTGAAVLAEHIGAGRPARRRAGLGPLELAAFACLAAIAWQALSTGGLDAAQVGDEAGLPALLLVPGLALFAGGVLVARALPRGFGALERLVRGRSVPARLALLGLTRGGALVAAATTFLALALGGALFALDYRATLSGQLEAQAAFTAGTGWRVVAPDPPPGAAAPASVAPLTRFAAVSAEPPRPVVRSRALVSAGARLVDARGATLLAVPGGRVAATSGWAPPADLERRLRTGARVSGPPIDPRARELRVWMRSTTPGAVVVELLLPGQRFSRLTLGDLPADRWTLVRGHVGRRDRGGQVVGVTLSSRQSPTKMVIELGAIAQRVPGAGWSRAVDLDGWRVAAGWFGQRGRVADAAFTSGPLERGVRAAIPETDVPMLRPPYPVPEEIPALVSGPLARTAVDGRLTATVRGRPLPVRVVGVAPLLPTVTSEPDRFLLVDYDTLVAAISAQRPGEAVPNEAWFGGAPPADGVAAGPAGAQVVSRAGLAARARRDALASGASTVLAVTAALAGVLAAAGLLLAAGSALRAERAELAGWEALGVGPAALARAVRLRVLALYLAGAVAAMVGAALALRLVTALVAVTAGGAEPLPPIAPRVDWLGSIALLVGTGAVAAVIAVWVARATLRRLGERRLNA